MRFDDRLATVLAQTIDGETGRQAVWRQLTDLLAQAPDLDTLTRARGLARLREWRPRVPEPVRRSTAAALAWQALPPDLILFFAEDLASIAAPVIGTARADDADWARLIPQFSPVARALLRHRRDLGPEALRALEVYGPADLMLASPARETAPPPQC